MNKLFIMRAHLLWIAVMTASCLWVSGCTQEEKYPFLQEKDKDSGIVIPINISIAEMVSTMLTLQTILCPPVIMLL